MFSPIWMQSAPPCRKVCNIIIIFFFSWHKITFHYHDDDDDLFEKNWTETRIEILIDILEEARQPKLHLVVCHDDDDDDLYIYNNGDDDDDDDDYDNDDDIDHDKGQR